MGPSRISMFLVLACFQLAFFAATTATSNKQRATTNNKQQATENNKQQATISNDKNNGSSNNNNNNNNNKRRRNRQPNKNTKTIKAKLAEVLDLFPCACWFLFFEGRFLAYILAWLRPCLPPFLLGQIMWLKMCELKNSTKVWKQLLEQHGTHSNWAIYFWR